MVETDRTCTYGRSAKPTAQASGKSTMKLRAELPLLDLDGDVD